MVAPQVSITSSLHLFYCFNTVRQSHRLGNLHKLKQTYGTTLKRVTTISRPLSNITKPHNNMTRLALVCRESGGSEQARELPGLAISKESGRDVLEEEGRTLTHMLLSIYNVSRSHICPSPGQPETILENCFSGH